MQTYSSALIDRARDLRRDMTPAEKLLWYGCLRHLPVKFRRQRPFGRYIVDFYCPALKLVIEVDGESHFDEQGLAYDRERSAYLVGLGLTVIRFANDEVLHNLAGVHERIGPYLSAGDGPPCLEDGPPCLAAQAVPPTAQGG